MFRVFSKFNALFIRPKIRGAIGEYQSQLIGNVKHDILALHERFKQQYGNSEAHLMAQLRDLPSVSGAIIWVRQIERQLDSYMKKVEDVLGKDWTLHLEGQKLKTEGDNFRKKLDARPIFESWLHDVIKRKISIAGRLFGICRNRTIGNFMELSINFDPQVIALFKEVRNLTWLNYQIPHAISNVSKEAKRVYPYAVSLMESVRSLAQTSRIIDEMSGVSILLSGYQKDVQDLVSKGVPLKWESFIHSYDLQMRQGPLLTNGASDRSAPFTRSESKHVQFVREFAAAVLTLQNKTAALVESNDAVQRAIEELRTCPYDKSTLRKRLDSIQTAVDQLNLENYTNLGYWVGGMNDMIESIMIERVQKAMHVWMESFLSFQPGSPIQNSTRNDESKNSDETDI
ncbi:MAG: hypothetical protein Q9187_009512, partial [Circinaria calcarea]